MKDDFVLYGPDGRELQRPSKSFPWLTVAILLLPVVSLTANHFYRKHQEQSLLAPMTWIASSASVITIENSSLDVPDLGAPTDSPPSKVVTDQAIYRICYTTLKQLGKFNSLAQTNLETHKIWLPQNASTESRREYLYHELMHIAFANSGGYESQAYAQYGKDEQFINPTSPEMLDILRRNPKMADWLERR